MTPPIADTVDAIYRAESRRIFATLVRLLGDFDLADPAPARDDDTEDLEDDRLRLVFTCCHPALAPDAQVALTLREVRGLRSRA